MVPPKYNFYVGPAFSAYINSGITINNSGEFISESDKYASGLNSINNERPFVFFNLVSANSYNAIFFYDSSKNLISYRTLQSLNNTVINPPSNAKYWGVRFTNADANFMSKKGTNFIYNLSAVNPHYKDLSKKYTKESGQEFFRISLDGKINLFGQDYDFVANSDLEDQLIFIIDKYNRISGKWIEYYKGEFNKTDCKLDHDKKKCELKITTIDDYNEVMNSYENTYDLIKLAPAITHINLHKRSLMQVYVRGANSISNFFGGIYWEDDVNEAIDDHDALINKYHFAYIKAGNEFYVKNAGIPEINGVYAGTNGQWDNWNGYTCYMGTDKPYTKAYIYIKRNSDNTILYKSEKQWVFNEADNCYIGREDIKMVNVNDASDKFTIESPFVYHIYRRLLCDVDTVTDSEGTKNTYTLPLNDFVTDNRNYKKCIGLTGGLFFSTSRAVNEPTRYGLNDYGQYFTNQFIPSSTGIARPLPISRNSWANASLWYVYNELSYGIFEEKLRKQYTLKDSYSIAAVIKVLLNKIDPTLKHEATAEYSQFLYGSNMPLTGIDRFYIYITQKTNILKGEYDQPAQKAEISLEDLMKMLRDCFRCYWYIENGKFKIEHISFFMKGGSYSYNNNVQLDFTKLTDQFNKKLFSYFQSEVEYDKSELNQRYEFGWMDDVTDLFDGVTIDVNSSYIQKGKNEEINISQFSSDIDYMLFNPSSFSNDGFALLCPTGPVNPAFIASTKGYMNINGTVDTSMGTITKYDVTNSKSVLISLSTYLSAVGWCTIWVVDKNENPILMLLAEVTGNILTDYPLTIPENGVQLWVQSENPEVKASGSLTLPIIETQRLDENGNSYKAIIQNIYASWPYLIRFYMYDMPGYKCNCNVLENLSVESIKMCMKQTIEFTSEEDLDELELIKTSIENGKIDEYSVNMNTRVAKVKLMYKPQ